MIRRSHKIVSISPQEIINSDTGDTYNVVLFDDAIGSFPSIQELIDFKERIDNTIRALNEHYDGDHERVNAELSQEYYLQENAKNQDVPTRDKYRNQGNTYIYLMKSNLNGFVKIGKSINPRAREKTLQSEDPLLELVFVSPLIDGVNELFLHDKFRSKRIRGEWFNLTNEDVESIKIQLQK
jgi:Meiotically up-regulated gene 113